MKNTVQCRICCVQVENIEEHLKELHKHELELAMLTGNADDVSLWIRECKVEQPQEISSVVKKEADAVMNSTADEDCPNEEEFATNYQHSFLNETNFESSNSFENSNLSSTEINEATTAGSAQPVLNALNAAQRIQRLIKFNTTDHRSNAMKKATCHLCGMTDPNKHKHALRHMNIINMFACSFCDMTHTWNRQVIIEHGKRKHDTNYALISQEGKYADEIAAAKMRCFPPPGHMAENLSSSNDTTNQPRSAASLSGNDATLRNLFHVGAVMIPKNDVIDQRGSQAWSRKCNICGQACMKKLRHALRHLNQFDMFSCTLCSFSHPWNSHVVEHHLALRHDVAVELTSVLVSSRMTDFEAEISAVHKTCFEVNAISNAPQNGDAGVSNRRNSFPRYDSPFHDKSACTSTTNGVRTQTTPTQPPVRLLTTGDGVGGMRRVRISGGSIGRPFRTVLMTSLKKPGPSSLHSTSAFANDHEYNHLPSSSTPGTGRLDRVVPRIVYPTIDQVSFVGVDYL